MQESDERKNSLNETDDDLLRKRKRVDSDSDEDEEFMLRNEDEYSVFKTPGSERLKLESMSMLLSRSIIPTSLALFKEEY